MNQVKLHRLLFEGTVLSKRAALAVLAGKIADAGLFSGDDIHLFLGLAFEAMYSDVPQPENGKEGER